MRILYIAFLIKALAVSQGFAQNLGEFLGDEGIFYAETKQLNQFFRRFNNEEDLNGNRIFAGEPGYREREDRKKYLQMLFDRENKNLGQALKDEFIAFLTSPDADHFLEFQGGEWFAEVETTFIYKGRPRNLTLYLNLQKEPIGSKWVISRVFFDEFSKHFGADTTELKFLHPMSHELEFMNLNKAFRDNGDLELYAQRGYRPDYVSLLFYEMKLGNMEFKQVNNVKFHFFQIDNWYFEVSRFNRPGFNRGWLMSNLVKIKPEDKQKLMQYIFYEAN